MGKLLQPRVTSSLSLGYGDYLRFSEFVLERFGLSFPEKRRMEMEIGVRRAFAASTCQNLDEYFDLLQNPTHGALELERLVNALTVGETYFFRDTGQFDALVNHVLPELIERRKAVRTLRLWSAGCASGEEPYSLAILLAEMLNHLSDWSITILATDINTHNLERARKGFYGEWAFRENRARNLRSKYFLQREHNQYELIPEIRRMVTFNTLNLASSDYPSYNNNTMLMDIILCRNVTIYFPEDVTRMVVDRFYNSLTDSGWLVIGHSEHSLNTYQRFHTVNFQDAILYQRRMTPPASTILASYDAPTQPVLSTFEDTHPPVKPFEFTEQAPASNDVATNLRPQPSTAAPPLSDGVEEARALISIGRTEDACDVLLRWLKRNPNHGPACILLGKAYADLGNYLEAERWCQLAIVIDKLGLEAYYTLALVYEHQGQPDKAIEMMKRVVYLERNDILGYYSLAGLYYNRGQLPYALKALENARRLVGSHRPDELVPRSDGITMLRLGQAILHQQRQWTAELGNKEKE